MENLKNGSCWTYWQRNQVNPLTHCKFDFAHLTTELYVRAPIKDDMQVEDDSDDVMGVDL